MGATTRLVITPLTERCWLTITSALHLKLGAAPAGPAGTGKTESTKDLAKSLGILCIVFNCSDQVSANMLETLFSGLCASGSWTCLDEFNRIELEVLSVCASQVQIIRQALLNFDYLRYDDSAKSKVFNFNERESLPIRKADCGIFITMNPG